MCRWTTDKCQGDIGNEWDKDGLFSKWCHDEALIWFYGKKNWTHHLDTADTHPRLLKDLSA